MANTGSRIAEAIWRTYVEGGTAETALPPMRELQSEFGVSIHSISAALRDLTSRGSIRKDSRGRGRYLINPNLQGKDRLIGLVAPVDPHFDLVFHVLTGIQSLPQAESLRVVMGRSDGLYDREREEIYRLQALGCVGVVLIPVVRTPAQLAKDYLAKNLLDYPLVLIDMAYPEQGRPAVVFDNNGAAYNLTQHFLSQGKRRIAFIDIATDGVKLLTRSLLERWAGINQAMQEIGLKPQRWTIPLRFDRSPTDTAVQQAASALLDKWLLLPEQERPEVLIAPEDKTAWMLTVAALNRSIAVPDQLAFAGFDNLALAEMCIPPFPTTCPDFVLAGRLAAQMILQYSKTAPGQMPWHTLQVPLRLRENKAVLNSRILSRISQ